jgi:hypothetical protein
LPITVLAGQDLGGGTVPPKDPSARVSIKPRPVQVDLVPVKGFVLRSVRRGNTVAPNLSFGSGVFDHHFSTGPPDPRQHPFRSGNEPVSGQLCGTVSGGADLVVPFSCCLSVAGIGFSGHPLPAGDLGLPCGRLTGRCRTPSGFHVPHVRDTTGVGAP